MNYHIDTGLIYEKFLENACCPLCAIKSIIEEQVIHEFLNDAVMEDNTHIEVVKKGFCAHHFDMMFNRPNKLSLAIQARSNLPTVESLLAPAKNKGGAKKLADKIDGAINECIVCDYVEKSMVKYYKTIAQMFLYEKEFYKYLIKCKGFCMEHYAQLLRYSGYASIGTKDYLKTLSDTQKRAFSLLDNNLETFCRKHDYRNANMPLGSAENALPDTRDIFYGKKKD